MNHLENTVNNSGRSKRQWATLIFIIVVVVLVTIAHLSIDQTNCSKGCSRAFLLLNIISKNQGKGTDPQDIWNLKQQVQVSMYFPSSKYFAKWRFTKTSLRSNKQLTSLELENKSIYSLYFIYIYLKINYDYQEHRSFLCSDSFSNFA